MADLCWLNGTVMPMASARLSPADRGLLFGDGLFETLRAENGAPCLAAEHFSRLRQSAAFLKLELPYTDAQLIAACRELLSQAGLNQARVRLVLTRGDHTGDLSLYRPAAPTLLITAARLDPHIDQLRGHGARLVISTLVVPRAWPLARHKTLNRLHLLLAREEATAKGADDALLLDEHGRVAESTAANVFVVKGEKVSTPPLAAPILPGVTRAAVIELLRGREIPVREDYFSAVALAEADEIFLTGSVAGVVPVIELGGRPVGLGKPGSLTRQMQLAFEGLLKKGLS